MENIFKKIMKAAWADARKKTLAARLVRYGDYIRRDTELVEKTGKTKYKRRLRNHRDKFTRWTRELEGLCSNAG